MAKTRAQRKAERRAREARSRNAPAATAARRVRAQHDTQVPVSGDIAEIEAMEAGDGGRRPRGPSWRPRTPPSPPAPSAAPRRRPQRKPRSASRGEQKRRESEQLAKKQKQASAERQRGGVIGFLVSCWAELKKVQWPDRETLIQATAVTILFVAVAAAYLGALDALFNFLIKRIL